MGPSLNSWSFLPVDRYSKIAGAREELSPTQVRDKRSHIPHSRRQGDLPGDACAGRLLEGQKGRQHHLIASDVNQPLSSSLESILAQRELHPHGDLNQFYGAFLPGFL